jgi:signal transduction histidine kinase
MVTNRAHRGYGHEGADNGACFDPPGDFPSHLDLRSLAERAENFGGCLEIVSEPGVGSRWRRHLAMG